MNNILVLYDSKSGNTAAMAQLVAEGARAIKDTEVRVRSVDEANAALTNPAQAQVWLSSAAQVILPILSQADK